MKRVEHSNGAVGEPMDLFEREPFAVELAEKSPAALGTEVEGKIVAGVRLMDMHGEVSVIV